MTKLIKPGVDQTMFTENGRLYQFTFPVETADKEIIRMLKKRGAVVAPRVRTSFPSTPAKGGENE